MKGQVNPTTTMSNFGTSYDINAINNLAIKAGLKPLSPSQIMKMDSKALTNYLKAGKKIDNETVRMVRKISRQLRRNARLTTSENYKQAQLMHGTIRQAIGEAGALGTQAIAQAAISRSTAPSSAVAQNTEGGTVAEPGSYGTEKGPVYAKKGRKEE